jgi:hypothetical protein
MDRSNIPRPASGPIITGELMEAYTRALVVPVTRRTGDAAPLATFIVRTPETAAARTAVARER